MVKARNTAMWVLCVLVVLAIGTWCAGACLQAAGLGEVAPIEQAYAAGGSAKNARAHEAYKRKIAELNEKNGIGETRYKFIDLTGDGVDEMMVAWWPSVYTYKAGKAKRVYSGSRGGLDITRVYKGKRVFVADSTGALTYWKWNGRKFVARATVMDYTPFGGGDTTYYWLKGKGEVSEQEAKAYVRGLLGNARETRIKYKVR